MMAAPTAIPHSQHSSHHHSHSESVPTSSSLSRSPTGTSPRSMVSPIYTQAGRSAFSLPGPNSTSTSPTTTTWYSAGFASGNSQRVRSPTAPFTSSGGGSSVSAVTSNVTPQHDSFPESDSRPTQHLRTASFGSSSNASSLSSADLRDEPLTPSLGRTATATPLGTSFEQMKKRRDSWSFANAPGNRWSGLASLRERTSAATIPSEPVFVEGPASMTGGPMGGLLRRISIGGPQGPPTKSPAYTARPNGPARNDSTTSQAATTPPSVPVAQLTTEEQPQQTRGRQGSINNAGSQRRRPSPMGERLLMGHFNSH